MKDETLAKLSVIGFIVFLVLAIINYENSFTEISKIDFSYKNRFICVKGNFSKEKEFKSCILGKIKDKTGEIYVFSCNGTRSYFALKDNKKLENIKICGKIKVYNGKLELIPSKISYS